VMSVQLPALGHGLMDPAPSRYTIRINGQPGAPKLTVGDMMRIFR